MHPVYVFITTEACHGEELVIGGEQFHHLVRVKRLGVGTPLRAALPDGRILHAEIHAITGQLLSAHINGTSAATGLSPCRITLYQAVLKGDRMELIVQKASELGVSVLVPLLAQRSVPRWSHVQAAERAERWQRIADAAAEQCERSIPLYVAPPRRCAALAPLPALSLLLHEREGTSLPMLAQREPAARDIGVLLGPEGGWDEEEVVMFHTAGARPIHLGPRILRAETASIAAITLVQYLWGDLGNGEENEKENDLESR